MAETLGELWAAINACVETGVEALARSDVDAAKEAARAILSHCSKLHGRLGMLVNMRDDASWRAEVDRALKRERDGRAEIPGQLSIADAVKSAQRASRPRRERDEVIHPEKPGSPPRTPRAKEGGPK